MLSGLFLRCFARLGCVEPIVLLGGSAGISGRAYGSKFQSTPLSRNSRREPTGSSYR